MNGEAVTERSGGILEAMAQVRVIPVATLESEAEARILADALQEAGILILEVTFRTAAAAAVIRYLRRADPLLRIGAGTILSPEQAEQAVAAGAEFLVSPGWEPELGRWCQERGILLIPGVATPSEGVGGAQVLPR
jgi:2-dehydro-3-deoxyphosphogluconate aldolase/(4S)-4-hydroxy-2-oxoglutarate aldolase